MFALVGSGLGSFGFFLRIRHRLEQVVQEVVGLNHSGFSRASRGR